MPKTERSARLADVAQLAGVSPGLVSRILNDDATLKVRPETRERVMDAIELLQYIPHASARALRNSRTGLLGLALHHVNDPIYAELVETAQISAGERGYSIVLLNADDLIGGQGSLRTLVRGHRVDGLLVQSGFAAESAVLQEVAEAIPSVVFNADASPGLRTLRLDDTAAARVATQCLLDLGHTRIAFVGADGATSKRRYCGYTDALTSRGVTPLPMVPGGWDADVARAVVERYFAEGGEATALVVASTTSALGAHAGVFASGRSIPTDVSLVGIHETWFARHLNPALTVVELPLAGVGAVAVDMLIQQIEDPTEGETVLEEPAPRLIVRGSTGQVRSR